jgi:hypothetical protein
MRRDSAPSSNGVNSARLKVRVANRQSSKGELTHGRGEHCRPTRLDWRPAERFASETTRGTSLKALCGSQPVLWPSASSHRRDRYERRSIRLQKKQARLTRRNSSKRPGMIADTMNFGAPLPNLDLKVVAPVRTAAVNQLPKTGKPVGKEEQRTPALVLLNVDALMWTNAQQLLFGDGQDDMTENDAAKGKGAGEIAAIGSMLTIGDFQSAVPPGGLATKRQRDECQ